MTKKEASEWIKCVADDKRVPKDVREMCASIAKRLYRGRKNDSSRK